MKKLVTHNGIFHSDEVLAIALLQLSGEKFTTERTRDESLVLQADIRVDVGGQYDPSKLCFDHHQSNYTETLSSAGMVHKYIIHTNRLICMDFKKLDTLVSDVDLQDNGIKRMPQNHYCNIISGLNYPDIFSEKQEGQFERAVSLTILYIKNWDIAVFNDALSEAKVVRDERSLLVKDTIDSAKTIENDGVSFLLFKEGNAFIPSAELIGKGDFSIQWDENQTCWTLQQIPLKKGEFGGKYLLETTGLKEEIFTHKGGFISKIRAEKFEVDCHYFTKIYYKIEGKPLAGIDVEEPYYL